MTTQDYLESLQNDMQTLKTNVAEKGVAVDDNDNFTTLSAKVSQISGGGDEPTFTGLVDMSNYINSAFDKIDEVLNKQLEQRTALYNNSITLYTPNIECQNYVISQRADGKYRIIWFKAPYLLKVYSSGTISPAGHGNLNQYSTLGEPFSLFSIILNVSGSNNGISYSSASYNSVEECLQAIQNNSTAYTSYTDTGYNSASSTQNAFIYSNAPVFDYASNEYERLLVEVPILSRNETIVQI